MGEVDRPQAGREGDSPQAHAIVMAIPHSNIDDRTRTTAKRLRRGQTDAERKMWRLLRPFRDDGISFRRQAPVGVYIVDFVWLSGRLVMEVDGGQHSEATGLVRDAARTQWLESQRFEILRFWNNDVLRNGAGCQEVIAQAIERRRSLSFMK